MIPILKAYLKPYLGAVIIGICGMYVLPAKALRPEEEALIQTVLENRTGYPIAAKQIDHFKEGSLPKKCTDLQTYINSVFNSVFPNFKTNFEWLDYCVDGFFSKFDWNDGFSVGPYITKEGADLFKNTWEVIEFNRQPGDLLIKFEWIKSDKDAKDAKKPTYTLKTEASIVIGKNTNSGVVYNEQSADYSEPTKKTGFLVLTYSVKGLALEWKDFKSASVKYGYFLRPKSASLNKDASKKEEDLEESKEESKENSFFKSIDSPKNKRKSKTSTENLEENLSKGELKPEERIQKRKNIQPKPGKSKDF